MKSFSDAADYEVASSYSGHILVSDGENTESRAVTINLTILMTILQKLPLPVMKKYSLPIH